MTVWRKGMLAECIDGRLERDNANLPLSLVPVLRGIYRVEVIDADDDRIGFEGMNTPDDELLWAAEYFRPLVHDDDNAELIARIKNCRPARIPVTPDGASTFISAAPSSHAAQSGSTPGGLPTASGRRPVPLHMGMQSEHHSFDQLGQARGVVHVAQNTQTGVDDHAR